jgi:streptomycin 6-kinase
LRIKTLEEKWGIQVSEPFQPMSYNYVAPARRIDGTEAVVKLGPPGDAIAREAECLRWFDGNGAPILWDYDALQGALLLERIRPGSSIKGLDEERAIKAAANVMLKLHKPVGMNAPFPTLQDWGQGFQRLRDRYAGGSGPLPARLVDEGEETFTYLARSSADPVLLHGDLHHENVLAGDRQPWVAIDPQGVIGDPSYEVGAFLRNPVPVMMDWPNLGAIMKRRVDMFSQLLGLEARRIAQWGFAQGVLSAIWSLEDHQSGWECALAVARALHEVVTLQAPSGHASEALEGWTSRRFHHPSPPSRVQTLSTSPPPP